MPSIATIRKRTMMKRAPLTRDRKSHVGDVALSLIPAGDVNRLFAACSANFWHTGLPGARKSEKIHSRTAVFLSRNSRVDRASGAHFACARACRTDFAPKDGI